MLSVDEALGRILAEAEAQPVQSTDLLHANRRVLAEAVRARLDGPPFDNSAMDGFAVRCDDLAEASGDSPARLPLQGEVIAGDGTAFRLEPGKTIRINTGAPLPQGAEAVVRIEDVELGEGVVAFSGPVAPGTALRRAGEDYRAGTVMLEKGRRLDPPSVGVLASLGIKNVPVARMPRVALLASGDELVEPGRELGFGQIYNSSRYVLRQMLGLFGAEVHDLGQVGDTMEATEAAIERAFDFDALVTTGGVSMGSHDFIRPALLKLGARELFWKVKQRPGKPMFVAKKGRTLCFGLPGNPVSVFVTALVYVRSALLRMQGAAEVDLPWVKAVAGETFTKKSALTFFSRADYADGGKDNPRRIGLTVVPSRGQGSHQFSTVASAAGLVRIAEESGDVPAGEPVDFLEFARLF